MVKIRLTRFGAKKNPCYRIVAIDSRAPRDGEYIEQIGILQPRGKNNEDTETVVRIDEELARKWLANGAQPTNTVRDLFRKANIL
jgi:small subunit ribosomal protein S16